MEVFKLKILKNENKENKSNRIYSESETNTNFRYNFYPEGWLIDKKENLEAMSSLNKLYEAQAKGDILEARAIVCDGDHNLIVDLGCMKGIIYREDGAIGIRDGKVRDIAVISRVNRPVCFIIKSFSKDKDGNDIAILSRYEAQRICMENYISSIKSGDIINARVTHLENFGAFADIGCGIISFLPIDMISVSRISHPKERFSVGDDIKAVVKSVDEETGRINLSHKELLGTWEENANLFSVGETVAGIVRSVEDYGIFVELTPNLAGLAELKEGVRPGQQASVYIKNIIPDRMKIKLIIIDTFDYDYKASSPRYFNDSDHMDKFTYSPEGSTKLIETIF